MGRRRRDDDEPRRARRAARRGRSAAGGVRTDLEAIVAIAAALGAGRWFPSSHAARRVRRAAPRHRRRPRRLPAASPTSGSAAATACSGRARTSTHPGTPRLFVEEFPTPSGRARFHAVQHAPPAEVARRAPTRCILTTGRVLAHYQSGTQTRRIAGTAGARARAVRRDPPGDRCTARRARAAATIALTTRRGSTQLPARLTRRSARTRCSCRFTGAATQSINRLTNPALDPISRMPEFKVCAVKAQPVGDGAARSRPAPRSRSRCASATATA